MRSFSEFKSALAICLFSIAWMLASPTISAAPVNYSFDFTAAPDNSVGSGAGNELQYYDTAAGTSLARVTSWYVGTAPGATLAQAEGHYLNDGGDVGLGICNAEENKCLTKGNLRGITQANGTDWVLIMFDQTMNLSSFTMSPDLGGKTNGQFADVTFYTGSLGSATDLVGASYSDLTTGLGLTEFSVVSGKTTADVVVDITSLAGGEIWGNAILIGPSAAGGSDRLLLNNMSTVVPIPAAAWLLLSALSVLFGQKKWADRKSD